MFDLTSINYLAVLAAAAVNMGIGYFWYGPLFGKAWMKLTGRTEQSMAKDKNKMGQVMGAMFLGAIVMAGVLAMFVKATGANDVISGILVGFFAWLGFVATTMLQDVLYEKKNINLASINLGYNLTVLVINGAILALWA